MTDDLHTLATELAQVMRDANTVDAWDVTRGLGPTFVPFDHFAKVAIEWMRAAVLPAHRRQVLDEAAEAIGTIAVTLAYLNEGDHVRSAALDAIRRLADDTPPTPPAPRQSVQDGPALPEEEAEAQGPPEGFHEPTGQRGQTHYVSGPASGGVVMNSRAIDHGGCIVPPGTLDRPADADGPDLAALKRLCDEATEGPWRWVDPGGKVKLALVTGTWRGGSGWDTVLQLHGEHLTMADAEFIAAARTAVPWLLAHLALYENTITWNVTCHNCATVLDSAIKETERAEKAEARVADLEAERDEARQERDAAVSVFELAEGALTDALDERDRLRLFVDEIDRLALANADGSTALPSAMAAEIVDLRAQLAQIRPQPGTPDDLPALRRRVEREQAEAGVLEAALELREAARFSLGLAVATGAMDRFVDAVDALGDFEPADTVVPAPKADPKPLRAHYGPTADDPDPGKRWCYDCGGEVFGFKEGDICSKCGASDEPAGSDGGEQ